MMGTSPMNSFMTTSDAYDMKIISSNSTSISNGYYSETKNNHNEFVNIQKVQESSDKNNAAISNHDITQNINYSGYCNFAIGVHRKFTRQDTYFLSHHKSKPSLFGVPLLIPICDGLVNKDLYCNVWLQVSRLLSPLPPSTRDQFNHAEDCDDSMVRKFI